MKTFTLFPFLFCTAISTAPGALTPDIVAQIAAPTSLEVKINALKGKTSLPELLVLSRCSADNSGAKQAAIDLVKELVKKPDALGRQELLDFIHAKFFQQPTRNALQEDDYYHYVALLIASNERHSIVRFLEAHLEKLGGNQLACVTAWFTRQDKEWLNHNHDLITRLVSRFKSDFYRQYGGTMLVYVDSSIDASPFIDPRYSDAIVDAYMVRVEHPGLGSIDTAFRLFQSRHYVSGKKIDSKLAQLLQGGRLTRAKLILWQMVASGYPDKVAQSQLFRLAVDHFPVLDGFETRLRATPQNMLSSLNGDSPINKELLKAYRDEESALCVDPLLQEKLDVAAPVSHK